MSYICTRYSHYPKSTNLQPILYKMAFSSDIPGLMAAQHRIIKDLKKHLNLRQRDFEILCACYQLSLAKWTFTTAKVEEYLSGSYFLPSIYDSIGILIRKGYLNVMVPGRPFQPERYEFSHQGVAVVKSYCKEIRQLSEVQEYKVTGRSSNRHW